MQEKFSNVCLLQIDKDDAIFNIFNEYNDEMSLLALPFTEKKLKKLAENINVMESDYFLFGRKNCRRNQYL